MTKPTMVRWGIAFVLAMGIAGVGAVGCSTGPDLEQMEYADQAEYLYHQGEAALDRGRYIQAQEYFNTVRNEYPYNRYAALANLRIADSYFAQEQYASAVQQYRGFAELYPGHDEVEYARWRVALAFYEQMPSDFFVFPPPHERDLTTTRDAAREMRIFMREFGNSEYADRADTKWREAMRRLGEHELYVAEHYMDRDKPGAAVNRLRYLLENFRGMGLDGDALFMLGEAHYLLDEPQRAASAWRDLVQYHPSHARSDDARQRLEEVDGGV